MSGEIVALVVVVVIIFVLAALLGAYLTAHRLDRLHIRTDLARASLAGLLERRHTVAAAVAGYLSERDPDTAAQLTHALSDARSHSPDAVAGIDPTPAPTRPRPDRGEAGRGEAGRGDDAPDAEQAENRLGVLLAGVDLTTLPRDLADEIDDVTDRVSMARRFYNDAVRDTRALREKSLVRALRLAGRAQMPDYVELVDPPAATS